MVKVMSLLKRRLWTDESMEAAYQAVLDGKGLREMSRLYNVPVETLRRRVNGTVGLGCKPGPATILSDELEDLLCEYIIKIADMGYGLTKEDVQRLAFSLVEKIGCKHPFNNGKAGRGWFDGFKSRHPQLTFRTPQSLSCARAVAANEFDFFSKLGAIYGRLNLVTKPMQVYNVDETGVSIVHKQGKVLAQLGQHHVYSITSAERGKTHTIVSCVSGAGQVLPPMMIYPRKQKVPDHIKSGCVPNTLFANSENGWINSELFLEWFKFFLSNIPSTRPIILIQDGHTSHLSIPLIELAQENNVHLLCLPSHTTHILQPLDVGVFHSFKSNFSKACHRYLMGRPGQVITTAAIASLIHDAWYNSFTPLNILSGFKKCGIHPLNPGEVSDRQLAPSKAVHVAYTSQPECLSKPETTTGNEGHESVATNSLHGSTSTVCSSDSSSKLFTLEQHKLFQRRFEEGFDLEDAEYFAWLKFYHPEIGSPPASGSDKSKSENSSLADAVKDLLVLPKPKKSRSKQALNSKTICITDPEILEELKVKEAKKAVAAEKKMVRIAERTKKKQEKEMEKEKARREKKESYTRD